MTNTPPRGARTTTPQTRSTDAVAPPPSPNVAARCGRGCLPAGCREFRPDARPLAGRTSGRNPCPREPGSPPAVAGESGRTSRRGKRPAQGHRARTGVGQGRAGITVENTSTEGGQARKSSQDEPSDKGHARVTLPGAPPGVWVRSSTPHPSPARRRTLPDRRGHLRPPPQAPAALRRPHRPG